MEAQWYVDRNQLRELIVEHPEYSIAQLAEETERSTTWVKKWKRRFAENDLTDDTVLNSLSRRRHRPYKEWATPIVDEIVALREELEEELNRVPGPRTILYYLQNNLDILEGPYDIPKSSSTIWRILDEQGCIIRPSKPEREPLPRPLPMVTWQVDFKDVTTVPPDPEGKQLHGVETLNIVDMGSSILVDHHVRTDFNGETVIVSLSDTFKRLGCPIQISIDRDTRFVGSSSGRDFPSPLIRYCYALGIQVFVCPPRRPDKNAFVERYNRTYKYECLLPNNPTTLEETIEVTEEFVKKYNNDRPHQGWDYRDDPPMVKFPPSSWVPLKPVPVMVNPDAWLDKISGKPFKRLVNSAGQIQLDKKHYYVGKALKGNYVVARPMADTKSLQIIHQSQVIKDIPLKGVVGELMPYDKYVEMIKKEAISEWQTYLRKSTRYVRVIA